MYATEGDVKKCVSDENECGHKILRNNGMSECFEKCPADYAFVSGLYCVKTCASGCYEREGEKLICKTEKCELAQYDSQYNLFECVARCAEPDKTFQLNGNCRSYCSTGQYREEPEGYLNCTRCEQNEYLQPSSISGYYECVSACPDNISFVNRTCVGSCEYYAQNGSALACLEYCPLYVLRQDGRKMCVREADCPGVIDGDQCIEKCSDPELMIYQHPSSGASYCVAREQCSAYYEGSKKCLDACDPGDGYYLEGTIRRCVKACGSGMTMSNSQLCVSTAQNKAIGLTTLITVLLVIIVIGVSLLLICRRWRQAKRKLAKSVSDGIQLVNAQPSEQKVSRGRKQTRLSRVSKY